MTKLEEIALAIFQKVASDPEASWDAMADEEREDALEWARAGLEVAREPCLSRAANRPSPTRLERTWDRVRNGRTRR
jgi:hypothetical protein